MVRVLLIDDDAELLRQMSTAFAGAGHLVQGAQDGQVGMKCFLAAPADLVVTDIIMPNREGIETIVALRNANPEVKIVAVSGGYRIGPSEILDLARHVGADAVLQKPFRPSELVALAEETLARPPSSHAA